MPPKRNIVGAMFDVRPVDESGAFDFQRFENVSKTVDLRPPKIDEPPVVIPRKIYYRKNEVVLATVPEPPKPIEPINEPEEPTVEKTQVPEPVRTQEPLKATEDDTTYTKQNLLGELEDIISSPMNVQTELVRVGGQVHDLDLRKRPKKIYQRPSVERESTEHVSANVPQPLRPLPQIDLVKVDIMVPVYQYEDIIGRLSTRPERNLTQEFWRKKNTPKPAIASKKFRFPKVLFSNRWVSILVLTPLVIWGAVFYLSRTGDSIKNNVVQNGKNAVANMLDAKQFLEQAQFDDAANSFNLAYDDFSKANNTLDKLGASFSWLLKYIPGLNRISSANDLTVAGENVAKVGMDFSSMISDLSRIKLTDILTPGAGPSLHDLFNNLHDVALSSKTRIDATNGLLSNISENVLPEDKRQLFNIFKDKLPELRDRLNESVSYSALLSAMVPESGPKKYLILFQNNSELRATGGFPGSYGVISFDNGRYAGIKLDDIYNPDGQLNNNVIPPEPLQHITQTWGMRDANWFADFPISAKKIMGFYHDGSGDSVDGVLTLTPDIIVDMLKITGPIDMPEYGLVLNADNFRSQVQSEVEYDQHKPGDSPKKVLIDFFPRFLAVLGKQDQKSLLAIAKIFSDALKDKHILAYFNDSDAEKIALENNFGGSVDQKSKDYLQVVFTNVKGSKTDAVADSSINLKTGINDDNSVEHELAITRQHKGGDSSLRFYNLQNPDYVRVYVPENAELESIDGNDVPNFQPLVDYSNGYKKDSSLEQIESDTTHPQPGVDVFHESGRKVFGFWMILDPKQTKTVTVKYKLDDAYKKGDYRLLVQKQSGTGAIPLTGSFTFPDGSTSDLDIDLSIDREFDIKIN